MQSLENFVSLAIQGTQVPMYQFLAQKSSKNGPNQTKIEKGAQHPRGPVGTLGVPIGTWQVPIGLNSWPAQEPSN